MGEMMTHNNKDANTFFMRMMMIHVLALFYFLFCRRRHSGASGHSTRSSTNLTGPGSIVNINPAVTPTIGQPETLRQKAFAKLRLFNFSLNWDLHMNQCK